MPRCRAIRGAVKQHLEHCSRQAQAPQRSSEAALAAAPGLLLCAVFRLLRLRLRWRLGTSGSLWLPAVGWNQPQAPRLLTFARQAVLIVVLALQGEVWVVQQAAALMAAALPGHGASHAAHL